MNEITKTRMLLTTAVFAAIAALSASGANARIPADTSSASAVQESLRTGRYAAQPPSWRGKGGKGEETGGATDNRVTAIGAQGPSWRGKGGKGEETRGATNPGVATRAGSAPTYSFLPGYRGLP